MSSGPDLMQRIADAGSRMDPGLTHWDVERLVAGARQRRQSRRARRAVLTVAAACVAVIAIVGAVYRKHAASHPELAVRRTETRARTTRAVTANAVVTLADGTTATALDAATEISVARDSTDRAELVLSRGRGRFDVQPRPARTFVVQAGNVTVTVLGTLFTVERVADRVGVAVESGTVRVDWGVGSAVLEQNASGWYPPLVIRQDDVAADDAPLGSRSPGRAAIGASSGAAPSSVTSQPENAADLFQAADKARASGHPQQATELLRRLLREHRNDARAPLAAFTLGRMLLMELGRPMEAASAFAEARRLSPSGPFAEDALAREVEAYGKAGATAQARARAEEYLRSYPQGRRAASVRVLGGIK